MDKKSQYYLNCGIRTRWHNAKLGDFTNDENALASVRNYLANLQEHISHGTGLYLWGSNGTGKSYLMNCAFKSLIDAGHTVRIYTLDEIVDRYTDSWYSNEDRQQLYRTLCNTGFLGIDEFGRNLDRNGEPMYIPDLVKRALATVLRYRVQMQKPVWITSNTDPKNVGAVFSEDIQSLLREAVIAVCVRGEDFRKVIQKRNRQLL